MTCYNMQLQTPGKFILIENYTRMKYKRNTVSKSLFSKMFLIKRIVEKLPGIFKVKVIAPFWKSYVYISGACI